MDQNSAFILVLQLIGIVSFSVSSIAFINSLFLFILQQLNQSANAQYSISLAITFICMGDSFANGPYLSPDRPPTGSVACEATGFIHMAGYMITWMFTWYVSYVMYCTSVWEKMPMHAIRDFTICLGIPLLFVGIQAIFGFSTFENAKFDVCLYTIDNEGESIFHWITFWGLLGFIVISMCAMRFHQFLLERENDQRTTSKLFIASKSFLQYYPILLISCWIPTAVEMSSESPPSWLSLFAISLKISHGIFVGIVYFTAGDLAKKYFWIALNPFSWFALLSNDKDQITLLGGDREPSMEVTLSMFEGNPSFSANGPPV